VGATTTSESVSWHSVLQPQVVHGSIEVVKSLNMRVAVWARDPNNTAPVRYFTVTGI
jgi:hypothetical protein